MNDLKLRESLIIKGINKNEVEGINIYCLYQYYNLSTKKRFKKGYKCFTDCKDVTQSVITVN